MPKPASIPLSRLPSLDQIKAELARRSLERFEDRTPASFKPFLTEGRYKAAHGGRGSGKSHFFAEMLVVRAARTQGFRAVCLREVQKSLAQSVKRLISDKIEALKLGHLFEVQESQIKTPGGGLIIFQGLQNHTADSIKSLEGFDVAWVEEAQSLSLKSLSLLRPTMRKAGSEIWFSWNPDQATDPVDEFLRSDNPPPRSIVRQVNWQDNPFFPAELVEEKDYDLRRDPDRYAHVWEGGYQARSEARVFRNWSVDEFEAPANARFYFGCDFGFSNDPTTLVRMFIGRMVDGQAVDDPKGKTLFIDYEAVKIGCSIDRTPELLDKVPESRCWPIRADSARPETIDYLVRHGFPKMVRATKGKGSVIEGVEFLRSFDIVVHRRCEHTISELTHYSYKVDPKTDEILPVLADENNHIIDAARYAIELVRRADKFGSNKIGLGPKLVS